MQIRTLIVDDEPLARARMQRLLNNIDGIESIGFANNGLEAVQLASDLEPDLIFMDIQMPVKSGLDASQEIIENAERQSGRKKPAIIFCTAYDQYAIKAFELNAADYLLKPVSQSCLEQAIHKATQLNQLQFGTLMQDGGINPNNVPVKMDNISEVLPIAQVLYFRSEGKHVVAGFDDGNEIIINFSLRELASRYRDYIIRVHRNALVNRAHLRKLIRGPVGKDRVELNNCQRVFAVSRRSLSEVKACFD